MFLSPESFYHWKNSRRMVDIRPANSFVKGSFADAISLPPEKFTSYTDFVSALEKLSKESAVHLIDLDGNLSKQVLSDISLNALEGGYKGFKQWRENVFLNGPPIVLLGGKTGSGKTEGLQSLIRMKRQVIDLEMLAAHRGSVFGNMPGKMQPGYEFFQNSLLEIWLSLNITTPVWIEEKGPFLGKLGLPATLYNKMLEAFIVELNVDFEERLLHIQKEYGAHDKKLFTSCIRKLESRIGTSACHKALHYYSIGQLEKCFNLLLVYYDRGYEKRRELHKPVGILSVKPSSLNNEDAVNNIENEILSAYKRKTPQRLPQGLPIV